MSNNYRMFFYGFQSEFFGHLFSGSFPSKGDPDDSQGHLLHDRDVMCCSSEMIKITMKSSILF